jgi:hypothetical protein
MNIFFQRISALVLFLFFSQMGFSQLVISSGGIFQVDSGAIVSVKGDVNSNVDITGSGKILLNGTAAQLVTMNGHALPNLEINNAQHVNLGSDAKIEKGVLFTAGKIILADYNLTLSPTATVSGGGTSKFAETNGAGQVFRELTADVSNVEIPSGLGTNYRPVFVSSTATAYTNAKLGVKALSIAEPNKPSRVSDYLNTYWPVTLTGVTGTVTAQGQYIDASDITGTEANLHGYFYNGTEWVSTGSVQDATSNKVGAPVTAAAGSIYGMNKFVYAGVRAYLQGAYNASTGLMSEGLRTPTQNIPATDPYRNTPYSTAFAHVNNTNAESISGTPFATQTTASDNIVDWVFLELRNTNASPGNTVMATRSALIQRDGDIVDVDGISPVLFNNISDGNYAITVRHRNHLSMSLNPTSGSVLLTDNKSQSFTANVMDLRMAAASQLYGTSAGYTTASHPTLGTVNLLWGGNANSNTNTKYSGAGNDRAVILSDLSNNELGTLPGYNRSDLNMNGTVKYSGAGNDRSFLLSNVLANNELGLRTEQRPN